MQWVMDIRLMLTQLPGIYYVTNDIQREPIPQASMGWCLRKELAE